MLARAIVEGAFQVSLGRVMIAAFMVAIFLGPRRWMAWAAGARQRVTLIRAAWRERREP